MKSLFSLVSLVAIILSCMIGSVNSEPLEIEEINSIIKPASLATFETNFLVIPFMKPGASSVVLLDQPKKVIFITIPDRPDGLKPFQEGLLVGSSLDFDHTLPIRKPLPDRDP